MRISPSDAHCHAPHGAARHLVCAPLAGQPLPGDLVFAGLHPYAVAAGETLTAADLAALNDLRSRLEAEPELGVGEIGLDRLRQREVAPRMREVFVRQVRLAAEFARPVVLHGAKCWGQVVAVMKAEGRGIPAALFHGFSRSGGLIGDIVELNGYISVGPAVLNDHAVNYRELVKALPLERLLLETDYDGTAPAADLKAILAQVARLRGLDPAALADEVERNWVRFVSHPNLPESMV